MRQRERECVWVSEKGGGGGVKRGREGGREGEKESDKRDVKI
jgi:hypothetical protein